MMPKTLEQVKYYQAHYCQIYPKAKTKGKKVLRQYLQKLSNQIIKLQGNSAADF